MRKKSQWTAVMTLVALSSISGAAAARESGSRYQAALALVQITGQGNGRALYERTPTIKRFAVTVEGLTPRVRMDVMVANVVVGTITTDSYGQGQLQMDSVFERGDEPDSWLPDDFPVIDGGELVKVGPLEGSLQESRIQDNREG